MIVCAVLASLVPILWESGIGSDVMKPIAAPIVGGMITSTIHVLILVPVFFVMMKERALHKGHLHAQNQSAITLNPQVTEDSNAYTNLGFVFFSRSLNGNGLRSIEPDSHWDRERCYVWRASHDAGCKCCAVYPRMRQARV